MILFNFHPAEDSSVDDEFQLGDSNITIQVSPYAAPWIYSVGEWLPDEEALLHHGTFRTLAQAQAKAIEAFMASVTGKT